MESIPVTAFKAYCLRIMRQIKASGEPILVTRDSEPLVIVSPPIDVEKINKKSFGCMKKCSKEIGDLIPGVDGIEWDALKW